MTPQTPNLMSRGEGLMPSVLAFASEQNFIGQNMATNSDQLGRYKVKHDLDTGNEVHKSTLSCAVYVYNQIYFAHTVVWWCPLVPAVSHPQVR